MRTFLIIWFGQLVSLTGSQLTSFALAVWVFQETGSTTQFALISVARFLPGVLISPLAGALADRWDRRMVMIAGDTGAACGTLLLIGLMHFGYLEVWHIYLSVAINSTFGVFQGPAYAASIPLLVSERQLGRANGLLELANSCATLISPALAGALLILIRFEGILYVDITTFLIALLTLSIVRLPQLPKKNRSDSNIGSSLMSEIIYGWTYLVARRGLFALVLFFACINFFLSQVHHVLLTPMILSFSSAQTLGVILSGGSVGWLGGSLVMSVWGGPRCRICATLGFAMLMGIGTIVIGLQPWSLLITVGLITFQFSAPIVYSSGQAILQSKVDLHLQGRIMAFRKMIAQSTMPLGYLLIGPLADDVFEPLLSVNGHLSDTVGAIIGTGSGRGMALLFIIMGAATVLVAVAGYLCPSLRQVEEHGTKTK